MNTEERLSRTLSGLAHDPRFANASFSEVARFVIEAAADAVECERVSAWRYLSGPPRRIECVSLWERGLKRHTEGMTLGEDDAATYLASLHRDAALVMHDVYTDPRCVELVREYLPAHDITSMLDAPFQFDGELAGVICFEHVGPARQWSLGEEQFCANMASLLSIALESEQRRLASQKLREEQTRFTSLVRDLPSGLVISLDGHIVFANEAAGRVLLDDEPDALVGSDIGQLLHPVPHRPGTQLEAARRETRTAPSQRYQVRRDDGATAYVDVITSSVFWDGRTATQALIHDVTDQVRAERVAADTGEQFRKLANSFAGGFTYVDATERYTFANSVYANWLDVAPDAFVGKRVVDLVGVENYAVTEPHIRTALSGKSTVFEYQANYPGAGPMDVQVSFTPDVDDRGTVHGFFALVTDLTEQKTSEAALKQAQRMESLGLLTGGISHDFNNLLAIILGNVEMAQLDLEKGKGGVSERLETVLRAAERGAELTHGLLAFSRQQTLEPRAVDIRDTVPDLVKILSRTLGRDVRVQTRFAGDLWPVRIDPGELDNALLNLAINARDAMPGGGTVTFDASNLNVGSDSEAATDLEPGDYVKLSVTDTGAGMSRDVLAHAFEPFFTTKDAAKGTGLGLSMVFGFVKQSGGHVTVTSEPGVGTEVHLYLPRTHDEVNPLPRVATDASPDASGETVLLVEDDPDLLKLVNKVLSDRGYNVLLAGDGDAARAALASADALDVVVTDLRLPDGISGVDIVAEARQKFRGVSALFVSGFSEQQEVLGQDSGDGQSALLRKPFRLEELIAKVRESLDRRA